MGPYAAVPVMNHWAMVIRPSRAEEPENFYPELTL
jgi:hypothetical protein